MCFPDCGILLKKNNEISDIQTFYTLICGNVLMNIPHVSLVTAVDSFLIVRHLFESKPGVWKKKKTKYVGVWFITLWEV